MAQFELRDERKQWTSVWLMIQLRYRDSNAIFFAASVFMRRGMRMVPMMHVTMKMTLIVGSVNVVVNHYLAR